MNRVMTEQTQRPGIPGAKSIDNPLSIHDSPGGLSNQNIGMGHPKLQPTPVSHSNLPE
jgi:hypothetical protein